MIVQRRDKNKSRGSRTLVGVQRMPRLRFRGRDGPCQDIFEESALDPPSPGGGF